MKNSSVVIKIADKSYGECLFDIGSKGLYTDEIKLLFEDKYKSKAKTLMHILEYAFGWKKLSEKKILYQNACVYQGADTRCQYPKKGYQTKCSPELTKRCPQYKRREKDLIIHEVIIKKVWKNKNN